MVGKDKQGREYVQQGFEQQTNTISTSLSICNGSEIQQIHQNAVHKAKMKTK